MRLSVICVLALALHATQPKQPVVNNSESTNKTNDGKQASPVVHLNAAASSVMSKQPTDSQKANNEDDSDNRVYRVKVNSEPFNWRDGLYLAYIFATALAAFVAWRALRVIRTQSGILIDSQRSWLIQDGIKEPAMDGVWIERFRWHLKVIGASPIRVMESNFHFHLVEGQTVNSVIEPNLPENPLYPQPPQTLATTPHMGAVLPPGFGFHLDVVFEGAILKEKDVEDIKSFKKFACSYGYIKYRDAFSKSKIRETRFCYIYDVPRPNVVMSPERRERPSFFAVGGPPAYNDVT